MAKLNKGPLSLSGTLGNITFVNTRTGVNVRAPRGTYKEAECNEAYKKENSRNTIVNTPAKLVHDVFLLYKHFKKSDLWQDILKLVRNRKTDVFFELLQTMQGLEANPRYKFSKILPLAVAEVSTQKGVMTLAMHHCDAPVFVMKYEPVQYCIEWHVLFIDNERIPLPIETINSKWIEIAQPLQKFETSFEVPVVAKYYVVFAKVLGGKGGAFVEDKRAMGVKVMKVGEIG